MRPFISQSTRRIGIPHSAKAHFHMSRSRRWRPKQLASRQKAQAALEPAKMKEKPDYSTWSHENLLERVEQLELELQNKGRSLSTTPPKKTWKKPRTERIFDASKYNTRLVALKLAYLGKRYNGFEYHSGHSTPLPTIEEELWKALNKARLIFPKAVHPLQPGEVNWEGCEYSKCGRTDKGVSAFGQVIGIRVRSNRPRVRKNDNVRGGDPRDERIEEVYNILPRHNGVELAALSLSLSTTQSPQQQRLSLEDPDFEDSLNFDPIADEIPYPSILNRLLPPDIRILAWCPSPPIDFSARFSCRERQYKYFFTQPAFAPIPGTVEQSAPSPTTVKDGWLDIAAMREAAKAFEGVHDFRNFCKIDPGKQITNFERQIYHADIEEVADHSSSLAYVNAEGLLPVALPGGSTPLAGYPKVYTFTLHGSAFLWHQVRHMVAVLFLVGQGLEAPSIVTQLLDIKNTPRRPTYEMATDTPLVLWDCIFPEENDMERKNALRWVCVGDGDNNGDFKYGTTGLMDDLWKVWRERKIDEMLAGALISVVASQGSSLAELSIDPGKTGKRSQKVFDGGNAARLQGVYMPVMKKPMLDSVESINEKWAVKKGFESTEDMKEQGYRKLRAVQY